MATNPRIPEHRDVPTLVEQKREKSAAPWIWIGLIAVAVLIAAIGFYMPYAPKNPAGPANATVPLQPTGNQIRWTDVRMSTAPIGGQMYIYARMWNNGSTAINGATVNVTFDGQNGHPLQTFRSSVESYTNSTAEPLTKDPIKPNQPREIRIPIEHVPAGWNHAMPAITVQDVTGFKNK